MRCEDLNEKTSLRCSLKSLYLIEVLIEECEDLIELLTLLIEVLIEVLNELFEWGVCAQSLVMSMRKRDFTTWSATFEILCIIELIVLSSE